jgi:hypothetical protein
MTVTYRQVPKYEQPIQNNGATTTSYYRWFQDIDKGTPPEGEMNVSMTGSPFTYTASARGFLIITGGSVSSVTFQRVKVYATAQTSGMFPVSSGDVLVITYSVIPTVTFVPQ